MDMKGEIGHNTVIVGGCNTPLTPIDRSFRQKIYTETTALGDTLDQMGLIDIFRAFHPKAVEQTFFSSAHGTFSRTYHITGYKKSLNKFKIEILSSIFSNHNGIKLQINFKKLKNTHKHMETKLHVTKQRMS